MKLTYDGIELKVATIELDRKPVWTADGSGSYLYTQFDINCICLASSAVPISFPRNEAVGMSWVRDPDRTKRETTINTNPPTTDIAIRHALATPRKKLVLEANGVELLVSPEEGKPCDCNQGPIPKVFPITTSFGDGQAFAYNWQCTTWINECLNEEGEEHLAALLSNRFYQYHQLDPDYFLTIVTEGTAYFRADIVWERGLNPDDLRPLLFLPIPAGYQREDIQVWNEPNVGAYHYRFVDKQRGSQFVAGNEIGATRAEVYYQQALITDQDVLNGALGGIERHQQLKWYADQERNKEKSERVGKGAVNPNSRDPFVSRPAPTKRNPSIYGTPRRRTP